MARRIDGISLVSIDAIPYFASLIESKREHFVKKKINWKRQVTKKKIVIPLPVPRK